MAMFSELVDPLGEFGDMPLNTATTATATTTTYHSDYPTQSQHTIGIITNSTGWKYFNSPSGCHKSQWIFWQWQGMQVVLAPATN